MIASFFLNVLTARHLEEQSEGRTFLQLLCRNRELCPHRYGNWEPIDQTFPEDPTSALGSWRNPFLWTGNSTQGGVWMRGRRNAHSRITLSGYPRAALIGAGKDLLREASRIYDADFGFLHMPSKADDLQGRASGVLRHLDRLGRTQTMSITTEDLAKGVPDVYWGTVFGKAYVSEIGEERFMSTPASVVERLSADAFFLQLTDNPADIFERPEVLVAARERVKEHLGRQYFFAPDGAKMKQARVPSFIL